MSSINLALSMYTNAILITHYVDRIFNNHGYGQSYVTTVVLDAHNTARSNLDQLFALSIGSAKTPFEINQDEYQGQNIISHFTLYGGWLSSSVYRSSIAVL